MRILALDLGTSTGYCYGDSERPDVLDAGTWKLATPREVTAWGKSRLTRRCDPRVARLAGYVRKFPLAELVVFEDVQFASSTYQVQLWASLRAALWLDYPPGTNFECVPVSTLKKFATGSGGADKGLMRYSLQTNSGFDKVFPVQADWDDNAIDAIWIWLWARKQFSRLTRTSA